MARKSNSEVNYTPLLEPGVIPPIIGQFLFNTRNRQAFDVGHLIPNTVQEISVCLYMRRGSESENEVLNVWLWTELDNGRKDIKFKRSHRYPQNAISTDSETFNFAYSPNHPRLYLMSDCDKGQNMLLELFVVGYAQ